MGFSSKLTEEEDFLKKKYAILRKKKKFLQQLRMKRKQEEENSAENGPTKAKQKKGVIRSTSDSIKSSIPERKAAIAKIRNLTSINAAANTEAAKNLIKSGVLKLKVENKTTFKRSLSKKKRDDIPDKKPVFQPFNPGSGSSSDQGEDSVPKGHSGSKGHSQFGESGGAKKFTSDRREGLNRFRKERKFGNDRTGPKKGNTIYIHGYNLSEQLLNENFSKFGTIVKTDIEQSSKSGFITFNSLEAADSAIEKMNDAMVDGTRLKVSLARRQKMLESATSSSVWAPLAIAQTDKGPTNVKDKRALVVYDDDLFLD